MRRGDVGEERGHSCPLHSTEKADRSVGAPFLKPVHGLPKFSLLTGSPPFVLESARDEKRPRK